MCGAETTPLGPVAAISPTDRPRPKPASAEQVLPRSLRPPSRAWSAVGRPPTADPRGDLPRPKCPAGLRVERRRGEAATLSEPLQELQQRLLGASVGLPARLPAGPLAAHQRNLERHVEPAGRRRLEPQPPASNSRFDPATFTDPVSRSSREGWISQARCTTASSPSNRRTRSAERMSASAHSTFGTASAGRLRTVRTNEFLRAEQEVAKCARGFPTLCGGRVRVGGGPPRSAPPGRRPIWQEDRHQRPFTPAPSGRGDPSTSPSSVPGRRSSSCEG